MKEKPVKDRMWVVREWDRYGKWNQCVRKTYYVEADSREDALAQYHARWQPDPRLQKPTIKASKY